MAARSTTRAKRGPAVRTSREEILEQAMALFLQKGYHGTSTTDVCESLGISRPTLYWYFGSKEELLFAAQKDSLEKRISPIIDRVQSLEDPLERLEEFIGEYVRSICTNVAAKIQIKETEYLNDEHKEWVKAIWRKQLGIVRGAIVELQAAGRAKDVDPTFAAFGLLGMITWGYMWFDYSRPESIERLAQTFREIFLSGLLTDTGG